MDLALIWLREFQNWGSTKIFMRELCLNWVKSEGSLRVRIYHVACWMLVQWRPHIVLQLH